MPGERTTQYLGRVLDLVGLPEMARRARQGHFDDYFCPPDIDDGLNITRLIRQLESYRDTALAVERREQVAAVIAAARNGEFDATKEESDEWARSPQGRQAFGDLASGR